MASRIGYSLIGTCMTCNSFDLQNCIDSGSIGIDTVLPLMTSDDFDACLRPFLNSRIPSEFDIYNRTLRLNLTGCAIVYNLY